MKWVIITISLFTITSIIWFFIPRQYMLLYGLIPMILSIPMVLSLSMYKYHLKFEIKNKKLIMTTDKKI